MQCLQFAIECLKLSPSEELLKKDYISCGRVSSVEEVVCQSGQPKCQSTMGHVPRGSEATEDWGCGVSESGLGAETGPAGVDSQRK